VIWFFMVILVVVIAGGRPARLVWSEGRVSLGVSLHHLVRRTGPHPKRRHAAGAGLSGPLSIATRGRFDCSSAFASALRRRPACLSSATAALIAYSISAPVAVGKHSAIFRSKSAFGPQAIIVLIIVKRPGGRRPRGRKSPPDNRRKQAATGGRDTRFQPGQSASPGTTFKPGQSGNPAGRPRGARAQLTDKFFDDVLALWERVGMGVLERVATRDTTGFLHIVASLMPKKAQLDLDLPSVEELIEGYRRTHPS
jgi:hypothetical protein